MHNNVCSVLAAIVTYSVTFYVFGRGQTRLQTLHVFVQCLPFSLPPRTTLNATLCVTIAAKMIHTAMVHELVNCRTATLKVLQLFYVAYSSPEVEILAQQHL